MIKKNLVLLLLTFIILITLIPLSLATAISGTVYGFSLEKVPNALVTIDTVPKQQLIAENSTYSFNVPAGKYTITAQQIERGKITATAEENITVPPQGSFRLDLILFPYFAEEEELIETEIPVEDIVEKEPISILVYIIGLILLIVIASVVFLFSRIKKIKKEAKEVITQEAEKIKEATEEATKKIEREITKKETKHELPKDLQELVNFIKSQDSRTTQKDIRKEFPMSEAKISLMIADLEQRGIVQKIKKGRGNIIILKK